MPRIVTVRDEKEKTNMYLPFLLKAEFNLKLQQAGYNKGTQAAAIRALMRLVVDGNIVLDAKFKETLDSEIYITPVGKQSKL